jgi:hypothetical protein
MLGYNYLDPTQFSVPIPDCYSFLVEKLENDCYGKFDQLIISGEWCHHIIINNYLIFQNTCRALALLDRFFWAERVVGISVTGTCQLRLLPLAEEAGDEAKAYDLQAGSLYCLSGKSR